MSATFWAGVGFGAVAVPLLVLAAAATGLLCWVLWKRVPRGRIM